MHAMPLSFSYREYNLVRCDMRTKLPRLSWASWSHGGWRHIVSGYVKLGFWAINFAPCSVWSGSWQIRVSLSHCQNRQGTRLKKSSFVWHQKSKLHFQCTSPHPVWVSKRKSNNFYYSVGGYIHTVYVYFRLFRIKMSKIYALLLLFHLKKLIWF